MNSVSLVQSSRARHAIFDADPKRFFPAIRNHGWDLGPPLATRAERTIETLQESWFFHLFSGMQRECYSWTSKKRITLLEGATTPVSWDTYRKKSRRFGPPLYLSPVRLKPEHSADSQVIPLGSWVIKREQKSRKLLLLPGYKHTYPHTTTHPAILLPSTAHWLEQPGLLLLHRHEPLLHEYHLPALSSPPALMGLLQGWWFTCRGEEELSSHEKIKEPLPGALGRHRNQMTWNTFKAESQLSCSDSCCWTNLSPWGEDSVKHCV